METTTFDSYFTSGQLQACKVLFPLLPPERRGQFAILIKCMELQNAMDYVRKHPFGGFLNLELPPSKDAILDSILPYCDEVQKEHIKQFHNALQQMEQLRDMMDMVDMMKELFPEGMDLQSMDMSQMADLTNLFSMPSSKTNDDQNNEKPNSKDFHSNDSNDIPKERQENASGTMDDG